MKKQIKLNKVASIGYRGEVTAKVCSKKRVIKTIKCHNDGMPLLFARLASILAGNAEAESLQMPKYLDAGRTVNGKFESFLVQRAYLTDGGVVAKEPTGDAYSVTFGCIIAFTNIMTSHANDAITELRLCSSGNVGADDYLVKTNLTEPTTLNGQSSNLLVSWKMYITNAQVSE